MSVSIGIHSRKGIETIYSPTHEVQVLRQDANNVDVLYEVRNARPDKDIELFYSLSNDHFGSGFLTHFEGGEGHFLFLFSPNPDQFQTDVMPKDIVFVIDESGSMGGQKILQAKNALKFILRQLNDDDTFTIVNFDSNVEVYSEVLEPVSTGEISSAVGYVDGINAGGGTHINDALLKALDIFQRSSRDDAMNVIIFLTDGRASNANDIIINNVRTANVENAVDASIFSFGVGTSVNTHLLDTISRENNGATTYVLPGESIEVAMTDLYFRIASPLLTDITIEFQGITPYDIFPSPS